MVITNLMTVEDLALLPDDGYRYELMRGELHRMSPTGEEHGQCLIDLGYYLRAHIGRRGIGILVGGDTGFVFET